MKHSRLLAFVIVALMVFSAVPLQLAHAQSPYSEKLNVYVAGSNALWYFTFDGVNGSSHLSALESTPGLSWYNVTAISTLGWSSDFQVFGPQGYNLLPVPSIVPQGMFLTVGADSFSHASAAADALDSYLLTDFVSMSNGTGVYSFFSPVSFSRLVPVTLLSGFLPRSEGGFTKAISASLLTSSGSPFVVLEGAKSASGNGFTHNLVVGSITPSALTSAGSLNVAALFGSAVTSLTAAPGSSSSDIRVKVLGGTISSHDKATISNDVAAFTGTYSLTLAPGHTLHSTNATIVEQPAPLLATRAVDVGVLYTNGDLAVTLTFANLSPTATITSLSFSDNWWKSTGEFTFLGGNDSVSSISLAPSGSITPVYRLEYTGTAPGSVTIPASVVRYQYQVSGATFNATANINPIRLSLGADNAVVYATLQPSPSGSLGKPVGKTQLFNITLVNVGTQPASSVVVAGKSVPGLAAGGGTATVTVSQSAPSMTDINVTRSYNVVYQNPAGVALNATTNTVADVFSQSGMQVALPMLEVSPSFNALSASETNLTLNFAASDIAPVGVSDFVATGTLPAGLGCGHVSGLGISCSSGTVTISYKTLNASTTIRTSMSYNLTSGTNYMLQPFTFTGQAAGASVSGSSGPVPVPAGLALTKQYSPQELFSGMTSLVSVVAENYGPTPVYNATVSTTPDSFDSLTNSSSVLRQTVGSIGDRGNVTFSYHVSTFQGYGNRSAAPVSASFYFGGTSFSVKGGSSTVQIYQPLSAALTSSPSTPEEGKTFTLSVRITNPSAVQVSGVNFTLPLPIGLTFSDLQNMQATSKGITVYFSSLGPRGVAVANASVVAGSGQTIPLSGAKLTFVYDGATINGDVPSAPSSLTITANVLIRYTIPSVFVLIAVLAAAFYVRKAAATVPASLK
ncbi:MAG: hypothetical protein JRM79_04425 [Nitrososphaerota archaeon]|nr:hypothetical protein [Nitrososphaerota archaeon]MDG6912909.1 hypothetical protein [Nitrososphaerota archaeon]MDG6945480.1 hypothetical protein [Nitrososphaerota archaeon]MDG6952052.1 hypothetical protein [Nitrososphaerota archaeon]MDG6958873.1 hypothetical protein [Nitrososphaerota archaeon]